MRPIFICVFKKIPEKGDIFDREFDQHIIIFFF